MRLRIPIICVGLAASVTALADDKPTWWAFKTPQKHAVPVAPGKTQAIDAFLLAKLHAKGLEFAPKANHAALIRRLSFDLTGLPPSAELLKLSYAQAVEKLLASPQYGERWGRHWLDVVRYGETDGGEHNYERPNSWPFRDYVIGAFNSDLPYNQFIREQIAGDVLFPNDHSKIAATGFLVSGPWDQVSAVLNKDPVMKKTSRMDELDDMVTTTSASFLGLTVNCARCHNHKFDPIPTRDYYRMTASFSGAGFGERVIASQAEQDAYSKKSGPIRAELSKVSRRLSEIEDPVSTRLLYDKYRMFEESRSSETQRIPVNAIYNRNFVTPGTNARYFRFAAIDHRGTKARIDRLELKPTGHVVNNWRAETGATVDKPTYFEIDLGSPKLVKEIVWSHNISTGDRDGTCKVYRFEASDDGKTWRTVASSTQHTGSQELDMPDVSDEELMAALPIDLRLNRGKLGAERDKLQAQLNAVPSPTKLYAARTQPMEASFVLDRGSVQKPKEAVNPGALSAVIQLAQEFPVTKDTPEGNRRLALAEWIASPNNPLTARVIVNRVWYYHFGAGIVNTPSDFGLNGDRPSHPELLDWLAREFVDQAWSIKWLHRQILATSAYQQSSNNNPKAHAVDAGNRMLWHMPLRRMDAETMRDSILWASGSLDLKMGGPSFSLHSRGGRGAFIYHALDNDGPEVWRRAVYRFVVRGGDKTILESFDCPDPSVATPQRQISNTPVQALALMNNQFVIKQADLLSKRLVKEANGVGQQIRLAYLLTLGRSATPQELASAAPFIQAHGLAEFCRALFNSNEFIYVP